MKTNKIEMTVAEIIAAINSGTLTAADVEETVTRTIMTKAEIEKEASDWWGTDWHAEDTEEIDERYLNEYGINLTPDERHDLFLALRAYEPDRKIELHLTQDAYLSVDHRYSPVRPYYQAVIRQIKCCLIPQIKNDFLRYAEALRSELFAAISAHCFM